MGRPSSVNPVTARTQADRDLVALLFRGLVRSGRDGRPVADLATGWTVEAKGARWTFRLRPDARWQDGVPVTSDDVVYTVRVLQDPSYAGPLAAGWQGVTATAIDARTVQFDLAVPLGGFLQATTQPLLPAHLLASVPVADLADSPFSLRPVGNGPFALADLTPMSAVLVPVIEPVDPGSGPLRVARPGRGLTRHAAAGGPGAALLCKPGRGCGGLPRRRGRRRVRPSAGHRGNPRATAGNTPGGLSGDDAHRHLPQPPTQRRALRGRASPGGAPRGHRPRPPDQGPAGGIRAARRHADPAVLVGVRSEGRAGRGLRSEGRRRRPACGRLEAKRNGMAAAEGQEARHHHVAHGHRVRQPGHGRRRARVAAAWTSLGNPDHRHVAHGRRPGRRGFAAPSSWRSSPT